MAVSYPASWTQVCNLALQRIPVDALTNYLTDGTEHASLCVRFLGPSIEDALGEHDWNGATIRVQLARIATTPTFGFDYYYQLPADMIRPTYIDAGGTDWRMEKDLLATDASTVYMAYIQRPTDPALIPPYLRRLIAARLAVYIVVALRMAETVIERISREYREALSIALNHDGGRTNVEYTGEDASYTWYDELR